MRSGAIDLGAMLDGISTPSLEVSDLNCSDNPSPLSTLHTPLGGKDLFAPKKRAAWKDVQTAEARCDFSPNRTKIRFVHPTFGVLCLWQKSVYGRTLTDIKGDDAMVEQFADGMAALIGKTLGHNLAKGDWALVTAPRRRHHERNFATLICLRLATLLGIRFYEDLAECHSKHRVGAVFTLAAKPPTERNLIVFDDFVTTGATLIAMKALLEPLGYNLVFFTGINNKL